MCMIVNERIEAFTLNESISMCILRVEIKMAGSRAGFKLFIVLTQLNEWKDVDSTMHASSSSARE